MDAHNRFETKTTFRLARLEWFAGLAVCTALAVRHIGEIRWPVFAGLFLIIDVVGYLPGAVAYRRSRDGRIARGFYVAYNVMHSLVTGAVLAGLWAVLVRPEWALLAVGMHLLGDRALFGNSLKPFGIPFEPRTDADFAEFEHAYATRATARAAAGPARELADVRHG